MKYVFGFFVLLLGLLHFAVGLRCQLDHTLGAATVAAVEGVSR